MHGGWGVPGRAGQLPWEPSTGGGARLGSPRTWVCRAGFSGALPPQSEGRSRRGGAPRGDRGFRRTLGCRSRGQERGDPGAGPAGCARGAWLGVGREGGGRRAARAREGPRGHSVGLSRLPGAARSRSAPSRAPSALAALGPAAAASRAHAHPALIPPARTVTSHVSPAARRSLRPPTAHARASPRDVFVRPPCVSGARVTDKMVPPVQVSPLIKVN